MSEKARKIAESEYPAPPGDHPATIRAWARDRDALMDEINEAVAPLLEASEFTVLCDPENIELARDSAREVLKGWKP